MSCTCPVNTRFANHSTVLVTSVTSAHLYPLVLGRLADLLLGGLCGLGGDGRVGGLGGHLPAGIAAACRGLERVVVLPSLPGLELRLPAGQAGAGPVAGRAGLQRGGGDGVGQLP